MNKVIEWIKGRWKVILIVLLSLMLISKCTSANNYERKLHKAETRIEYVTDSLTRVYSNSAKRIEYVTDSLTRVYFNSAKHIDSLELVIKEKNFEISSLTKQCNFYVEQNAQLNAQLKALANKSFDVNVNLENKKEDEQ